MTLAARLGRLLVALAALLVLVGAGVASCGEASLHVAPSGESGGAR